MQSEPAAHGTVQLRDNLLYRVTTQPRILKEQDTRTDALSRAASTRYVQLLVLPADEHTTAFRVVSFG